MDVPALPAGHLQLHLLGARPAGDGGALVGQDHPGGQRLCAARCAACASFLTVLSGATRCACIIWVMRNGVGIMCEVAVALSIAEQQDCRPPAPGGRPVSSPGMRLHEVCPRSLWALICPAETKWGDKARATAGGLGSRTVHSSMRLQWPVHAGGARRGRQANEPPLRLPIPCLFTSPPAAMQPAWRCMPPPSAASGRALPTGRAPAASSPRPSCWTPLSPMTSTRMPRTPSRWGPALLWPQAQGVEGQRAERGGRAGALFELRANSDVPRRREFQEAAGRVTAQCAAACPWPCRSTMMPS